MFSKWMAAYMFVIVQIPAISGALLGVEDFSGVTHDGWAGYGIGIVYSQIGLVIVGIPLHFIQKWSKPV